MLRLIGVPLQGYLEICGSGRGADFVLKIDCGSVAGLLRNPWIWMRGGLYAQIDCGSVVWLPRKLRIWTRGGLYAQLDCGSVAGLL